MIKLFFLVLISFSTIFSQTVSRKFENFTLQDYNGKNYSLTDFKNSKSIVIIFLSTECPVSNDYNSRMEKLYKEFRDKGISFIGINSNKDKTVDGIKEHAKKNNLTFIILKDFKIRVADQFKASYTPEVFVLSSEFNLIYHGRIDDSRKIDSVNREDLRKALEEIVARENVTVKESKAFGCTIKRVKKDG